MTTLNAKAVDLLDAVRAALKEMEGTQCSFWACKGPDVEPEDMVTCSVCYTIRDLRAALPHLAPRPVIDRDALVKVIDKAGSLKAGGTLWPLDRKNVQEITDAVLALINGSTS